LYPAPALAGERKVEWFQASRLYDPVATAPGSDTKRRPTSELTGRRDFIQLSPDQLSYETRSRRSGPTICYTASQG